MTRRITRRGFGKASLVATATAMAAPRAFPAAARGGTMKLLSKEVFIPTKGGTGVFPGFITYADKTDPVLLHRFGWVDKSDTYDNFHEQTSLDNGKTWSEPVLKLKSHEVDGGRLRYCENAAFFDADRGLLFAFVSKFFYPKDHLDTNQPRKIEMLVYEPGNSKRSQPVTLDLGFRQGIGTSFCFPIKTSKGAIVIPTFHQELDDDGEVVRHPKSKQVIYQVRMMLGEYQADGSVAWRAGSPIRCSPDLGTRGLSECSPVELKDGHLGCLCRGSNAGMPELPGCKWLSFSEDGGETWSDIKPLRGDDGEVIESSATGCACFRSIKNGRLYFIGNLCMRGERPNGNWPRSPLYIAEIQEEPFAVKRDTITVIDERAENDSPRTQISNFRYYQDRETGDAVVFATRFGETDAKKWRIANYYRYRVRLG